MFNRARPGKEIERIIGKKTRRQTGRGKKKKRQERGLAEAKQSPPAAREQLGKPFKTTVQRQRRAPDVIERTQIGGS